MIATTPTRMAAWLESAWLARYLERQLSGDEAAWFEAYVLDKPELLAMVEADTQLRDALAAEPATWRSSSGFDRQGGAKEDMLPEPASPDAAEDKRAEPSRLSRLRRGGGRLPRGVALAATLVLGLGLGWVGEHSLMDHAAAPMLIANPTHVIYDTMRGEATPPRIEHADSASPYVLVEIAVPASARQVVLDIGESQAALSPSPDGFVAFMISRAAVNRSMDATIRYELDGERIQRKIVLQPRAAAYR